MDWSFSQSAVFQMSNVHSTSGSLLCGYLMGTVYDNCRTIHCCITSGTEHSAYGRQILGEIEELQLYFPAGVVPVGVYTSEPSVDSSNILSKVAHVQQYTENDSILILQLQDDGIVNIHSYSNKAVTFIETTNIHNLPVATDHTKLVKFRVTATLKMNVCTTPGKLQWTRDEFARLEALIKGKTSVFSVRDSGVLIQENSIVGGLTLSSSCRDLMPQLSGNRDKTKQRRKDCGIDDRQSEDFIEVKWLTSLSGESAATAPVVHLLEESDSWLDMKIPVNAIVVASVEMEMGSLIELFRLALCRAVKAVTGLMEYSLKEVDPAVPAVYHFQPLSFSFPIMVLYPARRVSGEEVTNSSLEERRRQLHGQFLLPTDRPFFRPENAVNFKGKGPYLLNVHEGLSFPGGSSENSSIVHGRYSYHHYLHDRFDDNGWGCAYRSLQTIWSWFRYQGYTCLPVPTHRQIQETLVSVGDKPAKFVGSRQWIGSSEVGMCLNTMLGITYKIMFVNSGTELEDKGRELTTHFRTEGTPVMIGGGVLAHTILGVDFNDKTGQIKFLILDPHYTGADNVKTIQKEGWCGWKGPSFWDKKAHYNLCLPQRPREI